MIDCIFENGSKGSLRHVVVDVLVLKDDKILLVKRSGKLIEGEKWGLPGGYVGRDETLQKAAKREVFEETGWTVKNVRQLRVIDTPNRPGEDRQNIAFDFVCDALEQSGEKDWESTDVRWFSLNELPSKDQFAFDHADSIEYYLKQK